MPSFKVHIPSSIVRRIQPIMHLGESFEEAVARLAELGCRRIVTTRKHKQQVRANRIQKTQVNAQLKFNEKRRKRLLEEERLNEFKRLIGISPPLKEP